MDYAIQYETVIDGTGAARFAADVLIRDSKIVEVAPPLPSAGIYCLGVMVRRYG